MAYKTVNEYIASFPDDVRGILEKVRETVRRAAPDATEKMAYGVPTFVLNGNLVHYAAFKKHIGFYPTPSAITAFTEELVPYDTAEGTVRFPFDMKVPYALIRKIVKFRVKQQLK